MSNREQVIQLINELPESKFGYVLAFFCGIIVGDTSDAELGEV